MAVHWKHDVFVNFRGEDTRRGFVSHLYRALRRKPINTFIDAEDLGKGDRLSELLIAIRESRLSIVVFSQNYASSTWCLKELVEILECMETKNQIVLPIFYEVDPSDVRKLKGSFAEAFAKYELWPNVDVEEVQSWRSALARATHLPGWHSKNYGNHAELIEEIVKVVFRKLIISSSSSKDNSLVGMDSHMHEMHLLLHPPGVEKNDVRVVGIWGMGGLGKTTIARAVYDEIACLFEACCFLENVKEGFMKLGKLHMQTQFLSSISNNKVRSSDILNKGFQVMLNSLGQTKVLIVVDDVDNLEQIEDLLGDQHSFGGGSRIIITTRDVQLLSLADAIYRPQFFSDARALELFRRYAFKTNQPTRDYDDLSRHAVKYAQGLPLALKVLGASLCNKNVCEWEDVLDRIRTIPPRTIHGVLKTSFDGLDDTVKNIFLDISCFFKGMEKDYATEILDSCGFYPHTGIRVLVNRALITVSRGKLEMHDLLEEMGREIVRQQSIKEPGRRSRLWSYEDVRHVLTKNTATEAVQSIILDLSNADEVCLNAEAFVSMTQLRLLKINYEKYPFLKDDYCKQHLIGNLKLLSRELRCLSWCGFPLTSFPSNYEFKMLVDLDMRYSLIDRLWEGTQTLEKLKFINLSYCLHLKETPDFTKVPNVEKLILQGCISLVEVHPSISALTNLVLLNLEGCRELKSLSSSIHMKSLKILNLQGCFNFEKFPEILEVIEELKELDLSGLKIKKLPWSINNLTGLHYLGLKDCKQLKSLPSSIYMKSLKTLNLSGCSSLKMFPEISEVMEELPELNLSGSKIKELPSSINKLTRLRYLGLKDCKELKSLPSSICGKSFITLDLSGCSSLEMFPDVLDVREELQELNLSGSNIEELPLSISNLKELGYLNLKDCKELKSLPSSFCQLKSLTYISLSGCTKFEVFPNIVENMEGLRELHLDGTSIKELSPWIERLQGLEYLNLRNCKSLVHLPDTLCNLARLLALNLCGCPNLSQLPVNLVRLWDNAVEIDNYHTDILTGVQHSQTSSTSTTELRSESLTREHHSQTSSTSSKDNGLVEMDSHMHEMHLLLYPPGVETNDVRVVGIWGMGGLGKTTIARAVYDEIASRFEACCFLENVKEGFMKHGELHMQTQLLSSISGNKVRSSDISNKGFQVMLYSLGQSKVLIVADDVDKLEQIEALLGDQHSFGGGSRIIITTRDRHLLSRADAIYRPQFFSDAGSLELFRRYAFKTNQPTRDYDDLSRRAVKYAQGLPLALKVLGAFLDNKRVREWEDVLENVSIIPQKAIHDVLRTSFDGLDDTEKDIFLDIACFFKGMKIDYAIEILGSCGFYPRTGIRVLIDRALITVAGEGELEMHDSLQKMGREIVRQESIKEPGRRSRLWSYEDVHHVLTQNTATEAVESIILDLSNSDAVFLSTKAFASMTRLRLLKISHKYCILKYNYFVIQHLIGNLKFLSGELRCLSWIGFPLKSLPSNFQFKNLVDLDMQYSLIDRLWEGTQALEKLKFINLSYCQFLKETPDFTKVPNLEKLILQSCMSLIEVHPSISTLTNLVLLNLNGCKELKILANSIRVKSLKTLDLSGCSSLEMFPDILEVMEELEELNLSGSKIKELPLSINNLTGLRYLGLKDCKELKSLPSNICQLQSLAYVTLSGCTKFEEFPSIEENMVGLRVLHLDGTSMKELSPSIVRLPGLEVLNLRDCRSLVHLPDTLCNLSHLVDLNLCGCTNLSQ